MSAPTLNQILGVLEMLAPLEGSAEWDNTGLLVEGSGSDIRNILLTLDLTPAVAAEAKRLGSSMIVSYHPPIFGGLRELTQSDPMQAALLSLIRQGIHVYSPHTALDAAPEGLSDWLADCFDSREVLPHEGSGRIMSLGTAVSLNDLTRIWSAYLQTPYLRVAAPEGRRKKIRTLALCPGAGASALAGLQVDAVLTGEMKHHDILSWQRAGTAVVLAEHGHTERPYLAVLRKRMMSQLPGVRIAVSKKDHEPLNLVLPDA
jgi:dinuclear metal center YbgI/SA1388 family protein